MPRDAGYGAVDFRGGVDRRSGWETRDPRARQTRCEARPKRGARLYLKAFVDLLA
jgi:hypothetical protein